MKQNIVLPIETLNILCSKSCNFLFFQKDPICAECELFKVRLMKLKHTNDKENNIVFIMRCDECLNAEESADKQ